MASAFLNAQEYANVMLLLLKNQLVFGKLVDGKFSDQVTDENGLTISVKRPPRFIDKRDGTAALATQDVLVGSAPVTVDQYSKVHISIGDIEYISSFNSLMQNSSMKSAAQTLAHSIDSFIAGLTKKFPSWVAGGAVSGAGGTNAGLAASNIATTAALMSAHTRLMQQGVPNDGNINGVVTFTDSELVRGAMQAQYAVDLNAPALQRVRIPVVSEINWYATQQLPTLTTGNRTQGDGAAAGAQVGAANQNVNYRDVKGSAASAQMTSNLAIVGLTLAMTIKAGEVFTIQNVFAWDWRAGRQLDYLQQFTVVSDVTTAAGAGTLVISPPIIVQGTSDGVSTDANTAFATVGTIPAANAYIKFVGALSTGLTARTAFHKTAISLVSAKLQMPFTGTAAYAVDPETGISIRYWRGSDISTGAHVHRWDAMYGGAVMNPGLGTRMTGFGG